MPPSSSKSPKRARSPSSSRSTTTSKTKVVRRWLPVVLYLPNLIGYARVATLVAGMMANNPSSNQAIWCLTISMLLDYIDGPAARMLNQCSQFGDLLDHYTDHITMMYLVYATAANNTFGRINIFSSLLHNGSTCLYMLCKGHYMKHGKGNAVTRAIETHNYWNLPSLMWGFNTYLIPLIKMSYAHDHGLAIASASTSLLDIADGLGMIVTLTYTIAMWV